jgi:hypothetical protein
MLVAVSLKVQKNGSKSVRWIVAGIVTFSPHQSTLVFKIHEHNTLIPTALLLHNDAEAKKKRQTTP